MSINKINKFIVASRDASGLGLAMMLQSGATGRGNPREPHNTEVIFSIAPKEDDEEIEKLEKVGEGIVDCAYFADLWKDRKNYKDYLWIFDGNYELEAPLPPNPAEQLIKEGFLTFGGLKLSYDMEHARDFGLSLIKKIGLPLPDFKSFTDVKQGLDYLDQNEEIAYVFKPDESDDKSWVTTLPENDDDSKANREIYKFLKAQGSGKGSFILQERKKGVEINIEGFMYEGELFFAQANFENKRKYNGELGKMIGCSQDTCFHVPLDCKIMKETINKLAGLPEFSEYTGFLDMNLIVADNEYYFLEFCGRFGFNAHETLFLGVCIQPFSKIMSDWVLGNTDNFYKNFRAGFGASVSAMIDEPTMGLPLSFDLESDVSRFYMYDCYIEDGEYYLCGYANEIGIAISHDYSIKDACEDALERMSRISYPGKAHRTDLARDDYFNNPISRYNACMAMKLFERDI